ncbi:phage portal protein [Streptococcus bovimastitidis]|uniref:Phage portal protein n=1 Tax=Streptococcus bovimastitidis TaxID=1856638 RepID=A0A1L8MKK1_9STRE|nr:phage portal protein [Streptococcus bovimastitidis]OJF71241.1 phage portal protein [Streptococcus bovimastitidis]
MANVFIQPSDTEMTVELLGQLIQDHQAMIPKYLERKDMYEGRHAILNQKEKESYKPDNRLVVNFAKYIVDTFNGYFIGNPINVSHENKTVSDYLEFLDGYNDQDDNNAELSKICSIFGHGYELIYADENAEVGITYLDPTQAFMVYDDSIRERPLFAVRYFINSEGQIEGTYSDASNITYFKVGEKGYQIIDEVSHYFGDVPMVEYVENAEKQGIFDNVITLINAFDKAISEKANDVEYYADAYLKILGAKLDDKTLQKLRDNRIINMASNDTNKLVIEFLQKPDADGTQENLLNRLEDLIFRTAMVANLSDDNFGNASGISLAYKLQAMDNLAKTKERKFTSGMNRRYKLIANYPKSKINGDEWVDIQYKFTRNKPSNLLEEAQIAGALAGITTKITQVGVLSNVSNPQEEVENLKKEMEETVIPRTAVDNGQSQVLETTSDATVE